MSHGQKFEDRVALMVTAAGSQKALARIGELSDGTLINWQRGLGVRPTRVAEFSRVTGVPLQWIVEGEGDQQAVLELLRQRVQGGVVKPLALSECVTPRQKILSALAQRKWTTSQLTKAMGYNDAGAVDYVIHSGRMSAKMAAAIVRAMPELSIEELLDGSDSALVLSEDGMRGTMGANANIQLPPGMKGRMVPLLSMAQAGGWDACHSDEGYAGEAVFALNVDDRRAFACTVSGNSMEPEIRAGDVVICSPGAELTTGCVAVVRTHSDQAFIKFWRKRGDAVILESANADYKPIHFPLAEIAGAWPVIQRIASGKITKGA